MTELIQQPKQHVKLKKTTILKRTIAILIGAILMAVGLEIFLVPNSVIDGGITGISKRCIFISYWFDVLLTLDFGKRKKSAM